MPRAEVIQWMIFGIVLFVPGIGTLLACVAIPLKVILVKNTWKALPILIPVGIGLYARGGDLAFRAILSLRGDFDAVERFDRAIDRAWSKNATGHGT
jgi:hypothetical protein